MVSERARELHFSSIVVDTHSDSFGRAVDDGEDLGLDTGRGHMDIPRMQEGGIDGQFFAGWLNPHQYELNFGIQRLLRYFDAMHTTFKAHADRITQARTATDVRDAKAQGKIAGIPCIEGGHAIQDDLAALRMFHELGVRYMTLTWNNTNNWADGILDEPRHDGLNDLGREIVREMNRLGIIVDISHVSVKTFWDAMEVTSKPVMASHSSALAICKHPRNMNDDQLRAVAANNGVVSVNFAPAFVSESHRLAAEELGGRHKEDVAELEAGWSGSDEELQRELSNLRRQHRERLGSELEPPHYTEVIDHIDHMVNVMGADHVGLGSDYDGIPSTPRGLDDCSMMPWITDELLNRGYGPDDVRKILGENVLRVMEEVTGA